MRIIFISNLIGLVIFIICLITIDKQYETTIKINLLRNTENQVIWSPSEISFWIKTYNKFSYELNEACGVSSKQSFEEELKKFIIVRINVEEADLLVRVRRKSIERSISCANSLIKLIDNNMENKITEAKNNYIKHIKEMELNNLNIHNAIKTAKNFNINEYLDAINKIDNNNYKILKNKEYLRNYNNKKYIEYSTNSTQESYPRFSELLLKIFLVNTFIGIAFFYLFKRKKYNIYI